MLLIEVDPNEVPTYLTTIPIKRLVTSLSILSHARSIIEARHRRRVTRVTSRCQSACQSVTPWGLNACLKLLVRPWRFVCKYCFTNATISSMTGTADACCVCVSFIVCVYFLLFACCCVCFRVSNAVILAPVMS